MNSKQRLNKLETGLSDKRGAEIWLTITYPIIASEEEKEALRCAAIREYEALHGQPLNREEICWTDVQIISTQEQAERFGVKGKYPSVHYTDR